MIVGNTTPLKKMNKPGRILAKIRDSHRTAKMVAPITSSQTIPAPDNIIQKSDASSRASSPAGSSAESSPEQADRPSISGHRKAIFKTPFIFARNQLSSALGRTALHDKALTGMFSSVAQSRQQRCTATTHVQQVDWEHIRSLELIQLM